MIKNQWSADSTQIGAVKNDIKHNREFGSLFQFFLCTMLDDACEFFGTEYEEPAVTVKIDYDTLHRLCVKMLDSIGQ